MTAFSGGFRPTKTFILNDSDGNDAVRIFDAKGFTKHKFDSKGDYTKTGKDIK